MKNEMTDQEIQEQVLAFKNYLKKYAKNQSFYFHRIYRDWMESNECNEEDAGKINRIILLGDSK